MLLHKQDFVSAKPKLRYKDNHLFIKIYELNNFGLLVYSIN
jgi:hypothetical protein